MLEMFFDHLELAKEDPLFGVRKEYLEDPRENKVFLTLGVYKDENLKTKLMDATYEAAKRLAKEDKSPEYLPIDGNREFIGEISKLIFLKSDFKDNNACFYGAQTIGGTSALRIGADFVKKHLNSKIYVPDPTWANHTQIFSAAGLTVESYPYYNKESKSVEFQKMVEFLRNLPEKSAVLLHTCCHNPTGSDLTHDQIDELARLFKEKNHFSFFDFAYLGFGDGIEKDTYAINTFQKQNIEFFVAFSASKNFSLYKQRVGALLYRAANVRDKEAVQSHIKTIIRANYSNPAAFGALVVKTILSDAELKKSWHEELIVMRKRIQSLRDKLAIRLSSKGLDYIAKQKGMFSLLPISKEKVELLKKEKALYLPASARINLAALSDLNLEYVAKSLEEFL